jgi:hypothetical protein
MSIEISYISGAVYVFMYFDMFYIQWHDLTKKDLWNKVYMNEWTEIPFIMLVVLIFVMFH